jgi:16S rRNA processing protein RimM
MSTERRILLGRVVGAFGVRGELKLESWTNPRDALFRYKPWILAHRGEESLVSGAKGKLNPNGSITARLPDVETRDDAEAIVGAEIWVLRSQLPPSKPGEYYWVDLEGLKVATIEGVELGTISHLFNNGANDVIAIKGERERYLPYTPDVVREVDLDGGRMLVDWDPEF